jgi:SAM-dependent methyltransferase
MLTKEALQEAEYERRGAYHRRALTIPFSPARVRYNFALSHLPNNLDGFRCLDFGGGDGALGTLMASRGAEVVVFDPSQRALRFAQREDPRLIPIAGKTRLPFQDNAFQLGAMIEVIEHLPDKEEEKALPEMERVLSPGGWLVVSAPSTRIPVDEKHCRHYSLPELCQKVTSPGFVILEKTCWQRAAPLSLLGKGLFMKAARGAFYAVDWLIKSNNGKSLRECEADSADNFLILAQKPS